MASRFMLRAVWVMLFAAAPLFAQPNPDLFPRFSLTAGGYLADFGTKLRVDPHVEGLPGTTIDLEKSLGLASSKTLTRGSIEWRPFRRHEIELSYFRTQRRGDLIIDQQIVYEDTTFPIQAEVHSRFDIEYYDASYTYWARQATNDGLGINLGIMGMSFNGALSATAPGTSLSLQQDAKTKVPLPVFGLEGRYAFGSRVTVSARGSVLPRVSFRNYQGEAYLARVAGEYRLARMIAIGAAWNYFDLNGAVDKTNFHANLGMRVSGVEAFLHIVFGTL